MKMRIFGLLVLLLLCFCAIAQDEDQTIDSQESQEFEELSISDLTIQIDKSYENINESKVLLQIPESIISIYNSIDTIESRFNDSLKSIDESRLEKMSYNQLLNLESILEDHLKKLEKVRTTLGERNDRLQEIIADLQEEETLWEEIINKQFQDKTEDTTLIRRITDVQESIAGLQEQFQKQQAQELKYTDITTGLIKSLNDKSHLVETKISGLRQNVLIKDSPRIWEKSKMQDDSLSFSKHLFNALDQVYLEGLNSLKKYKNSFILHLIIIVLLSFVFVYYRKRNRIN